MIVAKKLGKKKKIILIILLIGSLLVTVFTITSNTVFTVFKKPVRTATPVVPGTAALKRIQKELPLEVLEKETYQSLRKYGNWPVVPGQKGKANPFLPVFTGE